jgi:uncharacterized membrane protein YhaH (DUF805 family)
MKWYLKCLRQYADFSGRARRKEFWMFVLFYFIFAIAARIIDAIITRTLGLGIPSICYLAFLLAMFLPFLAVTVRRLHDTGKSGWWVLLMISGIGGIVIIIFVCLEGDCSYNDYGPDPKDEEAAQGTAANSSGQQYPNSSNTGRQREKIICTLISKSQGKNFRSKVVKQIVLSEQQPDKDSLSKLLSAEQVKRVPHAVRVAGGIILLFMSALFLILTINAKVGEDIFGDIKFSDRIAFNPLIIIFAALCIACAGAAVSLFRRNRAVTPVKAFKRIWNAYFNSPEYLMQRATPVGEWKNIIYEDIPDRLKALYPCKITFKNEEINRFTDAITGLALTTFAEIFPNAKESEIFYGVNYLKHEKFDVRQVNDTLVSVSGIINVLRYPVSDGYLKDCYCLELLVTMYFVKTGSCWIPVNYAPTLYEQ